MIPVENAAANPDAFSALQVALAGGLNAFSPIKVGLAQGRTVALGIWTDSTGNEAGDGSTTLREWPYLLSDRLVAYCDDNHPTHGVVVVPWPLTTAVAYGVPIRLRAGSTSADIVIYNFAVASTPTMYVMGTSWLAGISSLPLDGLIISHGHNHVGLAGSDAVVRGEFFAAVEQFKLYKPGVPISVTIQNPRRDDLQYEQIAAAWRRVAALRDVAIIDVQGAFIAAGKSTSLYTDNVHPNQAGMNVWAEGVWDHFLRASALLAPSALSTLAAPISPEVNLLRNGHFGLYPASSGLPPAWASSGAGTLTVTKDTAIVSDDRLGYSLSVGASGAAVAMRQSQPAAAYTALRGKVVTLAVKRQTPNDGQTTLGRIAISAGSPALGNQVQSSRPYSSRTAAWTWWVVSGFHVPDDCNALHVDLWADTAVPTAGLANFDQATLVPGYLPRSAR